MSDAYFGYMTASGINKINKNTGENDRIYMVCDIPNGHFKRIAFSEFGVPKFEYFVPSQKSNLLCGKTLYELMPGNNDVIWLVSDGEDDRVYIMHSFKEIVYMVGRMHQNNILTNLCKNNYKQIKC